MIDWDRIEDLRAEVGAEDFAEIAGLFLSEMEESIGAMEVTGDPAALSEILHGMKGSALNLGFEEVARLCSSGEASPGTADLAGIATLFGDAAAAFRARFPDNAPA